MIERSEGVSRKDTVIGYLESFLRYSTIIGVEFINHGVGHLVDYMFVICLEQSTESWIAIMDCNHGNRCV